MQLETRIESQVNQQQSELSSDLLQTIEYFLEDFDAERKRTEKLTQEDITDYLIGIYSQRTEDIMRKYSYLLITFSNLKQAFREKQSEYNKQII